MRRFTHTFPQRISAFLLCLALLVGLLPSAAFAAETDTGKAIQLVDSGTAANISGAQADNIYFGTYQQSSNGNGGYNTDPIKWRVLENADGQLFLLSDQNLDVFQYHTDWESVTWEKSTMRSWLNGYGASENTGGDSGIDYTSDNFIDAAFSEKEQAAIADTEVVNDDNPDWGTEGGNNTTDKIFLLSIATARAATTHSTNRRARTPQPLCPIRITPSLCRVREWLTACLQQTPAGFPRHFLLYGRCRFKSMCFLLLRGFSALFRLFWLG